MASSSATARTRCSVGNCYDYVDCDEDDEDRLIAVYSAHYHQQNLSQGMQFWKKAVHKYLFLHERSATATTLSELIKAFTSPTGVFPSSLEACAPIFISSGDFVSKSAFLLDYTPQAVDDGGNLLSGDSFLGSGLQVVRSLWGFARTWSSGAPNSGIGDDVELIFVPLITDMVNQFLVPNLVRSTSSSTMYLSNACVDEESSLAGSVSFTQRVHAAVRQGAESPSDSMRHFAAVLKLFVRDFGAQILAQFMVKAVKCAETNLENTVIKVFTGAAAGRSPLTESDCAKLELERAIATVEVSIENARKSAVQYRKQAMKLKVFLLDMFIFNAI
jgi:hypothetical protein